MADIELVIKLQEEIYKARQHWVANKKRMVDKVDIAIANGIPLDDIRQEIESNLITHGQVIEGEFYPVDAENINYGIRKALAIIDQHIGERSE